MILQVEVGRAGGRDERKEEGKKQRPQPPKGPTTLSSPPLPSPLDLPPSLLPTQHLLPPILNTLLIPSYTFRPPFSNHTPLLCSNSPSAQKIVEAHSRSPSPLFPQQPKEISDIKEFLTIARRKDAICSFQPPSPFLPSDELNSIPSSVDFPVSFELTVFVFESTAARIKKTVSKSSKSKTPSVTKCVSISWGRAGGVELSFVSEGGAFCV